MKTIVGYGVDFVEHLFVLLSFFLVGSLVSFISSLVSGSTLLLF